MKLRLFLSFATLLVFSACMDAAITEDISDDAFENQVATAPAPEATDSGMVYEVVTDNPVLIGGRESLNIVYPDAAIKANVEGRVFLSFVIDEEGNVHNPKVVRGIGSGCDEEAVRAISQVKFTPALVDGQPVKVKMSFAILFKLT